MSTTAFPCCEAISVRASGTGGTATSFTALRSTSAIAWSSRSAGATGEMTRLVSWLLDTQRTPLVYTLVAWPVASVPALALVVGMILGLSALGLDISIGPTRGYPSGAVAVSVGLVLVSPLVETLAMVPIFRALRAITQRRVWLVLLSAGLWSFLHSLVAPLWGLAAFWPWVVFSAAFLAWRTRSLSHAYFVTSGIHALHNSVAVFLLVISEVAA
jgi:hypothetical protein